MSKYLGRWSDHKTCGEAWMDYDAKESAPDGFPTDDEILFASYGGGSYEGDALVVFERDGELYEVHGSHCSCYGLEGQWKPEETSWEALAMRVRPSDGKYEYDVYLYDHEEESRTAYWALVDSRIPVQP